MMSRAYRSLAVLLIAVFVATSLPASYAASTADESQQSGSQSRARRGKNGNATTSAPAQPATREQEPARENRQPDSRSSSTDDQPAQTTDSQTAPADEPTTRPAQKKEPPPFDRPPINSTTRSSGERPAQSSQSDSAPPYQPPTTGRTSRQSDSQQDDRSRQSPPVMRRERNPNPDSTVDADNDDPARNDRQRPVLRRPGETEPQSNQGSRPQSTGRPQSNPSEPANAPEGSPEDEVIRLESTLVNIPILVSDRSGRYIPRLTKNDFTLYEDGVLQEITNFTSEEVPFNVVLLLDMSPSVQGSVEAIQDAALAFVRQMRPQDRVMVASFARNVNFLTNFTSDRRQLEYAIRSTHTENGTSVYDAVYLTVEQKMQNVEGRKALLLFSDGEDTTSSRASYDDAVEIVTESDVLVYGLRYPGTGSIQVNPWPRDPWPQIPFPIPWPWPRRRRGPFTSNNISMINNATAPAAQWPRNRGGAANGDFMHDITAAGGGPVYDAQQVGDLSRLAYQIAEELRHTYTVSYYPKNNLSNGGYRSIRVRVRTRDDLAVRHRKGYDAGSVHKPSRTD